MILLLFLTAVALSAQPVPKFEDYPAGPIYRGKPALPKLLTPGQRMFRTMIRNGAAEGPAFAGHIAVAQWGCGSGCRSMALIDSIDGTVHAAPFSILGDGIAIATFEGGEEAPMFSFRVNSRLLNVRGCPEDTNCASYFYEWIGRGLKLIRKIPATMEKR